jgi:hypothetical protein
MNHAKVLHTADEIHPGLKRLYPLSSMAAAAGQGSQTLSTRGVEPLDKRRVQNASALRLHQELLRSFERALRHAPGDLDDALLLRVFEHGGNHHFWPGDQSGSPSPDRSFDLLSKRPPDAAWILLHPHCHDAKTAKDVADYATINSGAVGRETFMYGFETEGDLVTESFDCNPHARFIDQ